GDARVGRARPSEREPHREGRDEQQQRERGPGDDPPSTRAHRPPFRSSAVNPTVPSAAGVIVSWSTTKPCASSEASQSISTGALAVAMAIVACPPPRASLRSSISPISPADCARY